MTQPGPDSVPTSADARSQRPTKKRALTPVSAQSASIEALFAHPDRPVVIPELKPKTLRPPPDFVPSVSGSSAGAGSGEFHVYKASRRRENERLKMLDDEMEEKKAREEWEARDRERKEMDAKKTSKNQKRREKARLRKEMHKKGVTKPDKIRKEPRKLPEIRRLDAEPDEQEEQTPGAAVVEVPGIIIHDDD